MVSKNLVLGLLSAIFLLSLASAANEIVLTAVNPVISANPNSVVDLPLSLNNTANINLTGLTWTAVVTSHSLISSSNVNLTLLPGSILAEDFVTANAKLKIPQFAGGQVNVTIDAGAASTSATFTVNIASASSISIAKTRELTKTQSGKANVTNNGNSLLDIIMSSSGNAIISLNPSSFTISPGNSREIDVSATDISGLRFGTNTITVTASGGGAEASTTFSLQKSFCKNGPAGGNLSITDFDLSSSGDDDNEWKFLDIITIDIDVENIGDDDVDDVIVEIGLFDSRGINQINDVDFLGGSKKKVDIGDLNDGDEETVTFEFQIPASMETGDYRLAVKTYSDKAKEENECADSASELSDRIYESIEVMEESDEGKFIAFTNIEITPEDATCGDSMTMNFDVYNVGDEDQDRVRVNLVNTELGIDQSIEITNDLDRGDRESLTFVFDIPSNAAEKTYRLRLSADYDYRNGNYRESSDDDTIVSLRVIGCAPAPAQPTRFVQISASLLSDARAGSEMSVEATIRNTGTERATFLVNANGYEDWAELKSISRRSLVLNAGESGTVTIKLNVDRSASGEQTFFIEVISNGKTESREVAVEIERSGTALSELFRGNALAWVIGIINVVLIILIIIIAVRVARKE